MDYSNCLTASDNPPSQPFDYLSYEKVQLDIGVLQVQIVHVVLDAVLIPFSITMHTGHPARGPVLDGFDVAQHLSGLQEFFSVRGLLHGKTVRLAGLAYCREDCFLIVLQNLQPRIDMARMVGHRRGNQAQVSTGKSRAKLRDEFLNA